MPPLIYVAVAWTAGLVVAHYWLVPTGVEPLSLALLCLLPVGALFLWREDRTMRLSSACALAILLAGLRYQAALPNLGNPRSVAHYNDSGWLTLEGVVRGYPDVRDTSTGIELSAETIETDVQVRPVHGTVLVHAPRFPEYRFGDRLRVSGLLETPPEFESFSYRDYLARRNIYSHIRQPRIERVAAGQASLFWAAIFSIKDQARDLIARLIPDPEAALLQGILLGIRSGIPADLYDNYNATGTSHIIVISGAKDSLMQISQPHCHPGRRQASLACQPTQSPRHTAFG